MAKQYQMQNPHPILLSKAAEALSFVKHRQRFLCRKSLEKDLFCSARSVNEFVFSTAENVFSIWPTSHCFWILVVAFLEGFTRRVPTTPWQMPCQIGISKHSCRPRTTSVFQKCFWEAGGHTSDGDLLCAHRVFPRPTVLTTNGIQLCRKKAGPRREKATYNPFLISNGLEHVLCHLEGSFILHGFRGCFRRLIRSIVFNKIIGGSFHR